MQDREAQPPHGLGLLRIASYPTDQMDDSYEYIRPDDPSPHWNVIETGQEVYRPNIDEPSAERTVRQGTRATLCVPLRVEGVLSGTLNLESPFPNAFVPHIPLVEAAAGAIGRTLADGRAASESDVLQTASYALAKRHQYSGQLSALERSLDIDFGDEKMAEVGRLFDRMRATLADLRMPVGLQHVQRVTLWEIFQREITRSSLQIRGVNRPRHELYDRPILPPPASHIATMLGQLLSNLHFHQTGDGKDPTIRFRTIDFNGSTHALVVLKNESRMPLNEAQCVSLYRYPVRDKSGRFRLGTYIAGLNARSIGASIYASARHGGTVFKTTIVIPVKEIME